MTLIFSTLPCCRLTIFMTHRDRQNIFILLSCSEIKMFEEGILGGGGGGGGGMVLSACQSVKQHKSIFLLKIQSKHTQRAQNLILQKSYIKLYFL